MTLTDSQRELVVQASRLPVLVAYRLVNDPGLVSELVSVGHLALCHAALRWQPGSGPWMGFARKVVHEAQIDELRRSARHQRLVVPAGGVGLVFVETLAATRASEESRQEATVLALLVEEALEGATERERQVFRLHAVEGRSFREIARLLGVSGGAAWALYHRALSRVQESVPMSAGER